MFLFSRWKAVINFSKAACLQKTILKKSIAWQLDYTKLIGNYYEEIKFIDGLILKRF